MHMSGKTSVQKKQWMGIDGNTSLIIQLLQFLFPKHLNNDFLASVMVVLGAQDDISSNGPLIGLHGLILCSTQECSQSVKGFTVPIECFNAIF